MSTLREARPQVLQTCLLGGGGKVVEGEVWPAGAGGGGGGGGKRCRKGLPAPGGVSNPVFYTHLRPHETKANLVCRFLLKKKKNNTRI